MDTLAKRAGRFDLIFMLVVSVVFLIASIFNMVVYLRNWVNCLGLFTPLNFIVFFGNGLQFLAAVLGIKIAIFRKYPSNFTIFAFIGIGAVGISIVGIDLFSRYQFGHPLGIGVIAICGGMVAIGLIGFLSAAASKKSGNPYG